MSFPTLEVIREFYRRMNSNNFAIAAEMLSADFVLEWPQSAERIRGRANFVAVNAEYPAQGPWCFTINRLVGNESEVVSDVSVTDGVIHAHAITFHTLQAGLISRQVEFWPEDYPAPADRRHLVEPLDQSWTASGG